MPRSTRVASLSQREGRDLALVLLRRADGDVALVRHVLDSPDIPDAIVGFHAQQAVEKALKAVLAACEVDYAKTHALGYLIELMQTSGIDLPAPSARSRGAEPLGCRVSLRGGRGAGTRSPLDAHREHPALGRRAGRYGRRLRLRLGFRAASFCTGRRELAENSR